MDTFRALAVRDRKSPRKAEKTATARETATTRAPRGTATAAQRAVKQLYVACDRKRVGRRTTCPTSRDVCESLAAQGGKKISRRTVTTLSEGRPAVVRRARRAARARERRREVVEARNAAGILCGA